MTAKKKQKELSKWIEQYKEVQSRNKQISKLKHTLSSLSPTVMHAFGSHRVMGRGGSNGRRP